MAVKLKETVLPKYQYIHKFYHVSDETYYCGTTPRAVFGALHAVDENGKHGLVGYEGNLLIPFDYDDLDIFFNFVRTVRLKESGRKQKHKEGNVDGGDPVYCMNWFYAWDDLMQGIDLNDKLRGFKKCEYGLCSITGEELLPCSYDSIRVEEDGDRLVAHTWKGGAGLDISDKVPGFKRKNKMTFEAPDSEHKGAIVIDKSDRNKGTRKGYQDVEGKTMVAPVYRPLELVGKNHLLAGATDQQRKSNDSGLSFMLLDETGKTLWDEVYDVTRYWRREEEPPCILMACERDEEEEVKGYYVIDCDGNRLTGSMYTQYVEAEGLPCGFTAKSASGWVFIEVSGGKPVD
ncbi:WG repeat-containing protein [Christensenellaceae bacterium OttesenSCG-928-K19]|nr:WG repeat-containing protein [Christensenellaceae bacterium OttesenSCG-928-K19]